jgi:RNA polymerase-binding transcription factor DksA
MDESNSRKRRLVGLVASLQKRRAELVEMMEKMRAHALSELGPEATGEVSRLRLHAADEASDTAEQETDLALCASEAAAVERIDATLRRAHAGRYGTCERCQSEIELERLEAAPETSLCIDCAETAELQREKRRPAAAKAVEEKMPHATIQAGEEDLTEQRVREAEIDRAIAESEGGPKPSEL